MKNLVVGSIVAGLLMAGTLVKAGDDVYDEFTPKKVRVTQSNTAPTTPSPVSTGSPSPSFGENRSGDSYYQEDDNTFSASYSDRIRRFHNPSVGFSAGFGGYYGGYNNFYDPFYSNNNWYNPGWNQSNWFTPRPYWDYYNFWNPFSSTIIIINSPWQQNWGWCNDPWSNFGWNNNWNSSWNNPWYNPYNSWWTPSCHNIVNNNWGWDYGYGRKTPVYTPRINTHTNSPNFSNSQKNSGNSNYQYEFNSGKNNGTTINKQQKTIEPIRYDTGNNDNYYKPKPTVTPNPYNNNAPAKNDWGSRDTDSGIKVIKKQK
jgi:hypothetical protein